MGVIYYKDKKYGGGGSGALIGSVSLGTEWTETEEGSGIFTQSVEVPGITISDRSMINLQPDAETLKAMLDGGIYSLTVSNNAGSLTAYAIGAAPQGIMTVQCTVIDAIVDTTGEAASDGTVFPDGDETQW